MDTRKKTAFALLATLVALMWSARDWIGYVWGDLERWQRVLILAIVTLVIAWMAHPFLTILIEMI